MTGTERYDFVCTINASIHASSAESKVCYTGTELLERMETSEGEEYEKYLRSVRDLYPRIQGHHIELGECLEDWNTYVYRIEFTTSGDGIRGMNVVIHAVLRAPSDALISGVHSEIVGVLYPKHIDELIGHMKGGKERKYSLIPRRPKQKIFEVPAKELEMFLQWVDDNPPAPAAAVAAPAAAVAAPDAEDDAVADAAPAPPAPPP
jgi:hypothetical protein